MGNGGETKRHESEAFQFLSGWAQFGLFFRGRTAQHWGWWLLPSPAWRNPFEKGTAMNFSIVKPSLKLVAPKKRRSHHLREECLFLPALSCQDWAKPFPPQHRLLPAQKLSRAKASRGGDSKPSSPWCSQCRSKLSQGLLCPAVLSLQCHCRGEHRDGLSRSRPQGPPAQTCSCHRIESQNCRMTI